jgi:MOSC domain-containing protein YiiM
LAGVVEGIYVAPQGGAPVERVEEIEAVPHHGLEGDRYRSGTGHWSRFGRDCQVTFVEAEDLEKIEAEWGLRVANGEHRRNVVTRGVRLEELRRRRFRVGGALFGHGRPCSVCRHVERLTEPGMTQALKGRGGMCARVLEGGRICRGDVIAADSP